MAASLGLADILVLALAASAVLIGLAVIFNEWRAERREDRERAEAFARRRALRARPPQRTPPVPVDAASVATVTSTQAEVATVAEYRAALHRAYAELGRVGEPD